MRRLVVLAASLIAAGASVPAWASDVEVCAGWSSSPASAAAACRRLAERGDSVGEFRLGYLYDLGIGVAQDYAEAAKWYLKSAQQGRARAQTSLGDLYANGRGVAQDDVRAYMWYTLSAARGDVDAVNARDRVAVRMTQSQIAQARALAAAWRPGETQ